MRGMGTIPQGTSTLTPQLSVDGAKKAIAFYKAAFGAEEIHVAPDPSGEKVWHASLRLGGSQFYVNDLFPEMGGAAASRSTLWIAVEDVDALYDRAVKAGATGKRPPEDMFWGDRVATVDDPFGQQWNIFTHVRDVSPDEMKTITESFAKT